MTRSASVTIPTQRPPSLTTGTPGSSLWRITRRTVSSESAGPTLTGSASMMSRTVRLIAGGSLWSGRGGRSAGVGQRLDDVAGDDAVDAALRAGPHAGAGVQPHRGAGGRERVQIARQHGGEHAAEHVAGAGGGQGGGGPRADSDAAAGPGGERVL